MKATYTITEETDELTIVAGRMVASFHGRRCAFVVTSYCVDPYFALTFELFPADREDSGDVTDAVMNGVLRLPEGKGRDRRVVEQELAVRSMGAAVVSLSEVNEGGVAAGRTIAAAALRKYEAMLERIRQDIRTSLADAMRERATAFIERQFGSRTRETAERLLGELHWPLLLTPSGCGDECVNVVDYSLTHNPPVWHPIGYAGEPDVEPLTRRDEASAVKQLDIPSAKARALLHQVCGEEVAREFEQTGGITVRSGDYTFHVKPNRFVACVDPGGRSAKLCIHTVGFSCNPIDELVIAYLNIKHRLREYFATAICHGSDPGFVFPR